MKILFFIVFTNFSFRAYSDCLDRDLVNETTKKFPALKSYYSSTVGQGNLGICFSFPAAALLSQKYGVPISPLSVANNILFTQYHGLGLNIKNGMEDFSYRLSFFGSTIDGTFEALKNKNLCLVKNINNNPVFNSSLNELVDFKNTYIKLKNIQEKEKAFQDWGEKEIFKCENQVSFLKLFPDINLHEMTSILKQSTNRSFSYFLQNIDKISCAEKFKVPEIQYKIYSKSDTNSFKDVLESLIARGKFASVGIRTGEGGHAITLVGQKKINGKCFFSFKNSIGKLSCGTSGKSIENILFCNQDGTFDLEESHVNDLVLQVGELI